MSRRTVLSLAAAWLILVSLSLPAAADQRGVFVSPATGVSVGSVPFLDTLVLQRYSSRGFSIRCADKGSRSG